MYAGDCWCCCWSEVGGEAGGWATEGVNGLTGGGCEKVPTGSPSGSTCNGSLVLLLLWLLSFVSFSGVILSCVDGLGSLVVKTIKTLN